MFPEIVDVIVDVPLFDVLPPFDSVFSVGLKSALFSVVAKFVTIAGVSVNTLPVVSFVVVSVLL